MSDVSNIPRSTSVSIPEDWKAAKQAKPHSHPYSTGTTGSHNTQNSTTEPILTVNPVVLWDVDEITL